MRIDLHTHSSASDGTERPSEVMRRAGLAGLDVVALTDHDTQAGHDEARRALPAGLALVPGMELSCRLDGHSVHMLAFHADPGHQELAQACRDIVEGRRSRGQQMVERLRALGVDITWPQVEAIAGGGVVGRPHIARAMTEAGAVSSPEQAFTREWIGTGGRAHVGRYALDPVVAVGLVRAAGGVTVLAHPGAASKSWQVPDDVIASLAAAGLAGLEVSHPEQNQAERDHLAALAASLGLAVTGGSDDHGSLTGHRIGAELTAPEAYEQLMAGAGRPSSAGERGVRTP